MKNGTIKRGAYGLVFKGMVNFELWFEEEGEEEKNSAKYGLCILISGYFERRKC